MGFLSSAWKSIKNGFKKVFSKVLKPFSKILNSKFFKGAMLAVSVFTAGASLLGAFSSGGMKGVGNLILKKAAEVVTMPIDIIAGGMNSLGGAVGGSVGGGLQSFAQTIQGGLGGIKDFAGSVFGQPTSGINTEQVGQLAEEATSGAAQEMLDLPDSAQQPTTLPGSGGLDPSMAEGGSPIDYTGQANQSSQLFDPNGPESYSNPLFDPQAMGPSAPAPQAPDPSAGLSGGTGAGGSSAAEQAGDAASESGGMLSQLGKKASGLGSKLNSFVGKLNENAEGWKLVTDTVGGMFEEDPYQQQADARNRMWDHRNAAFDQYASTGYNTWKPQNLDPLRQRNAGFMTQAAQSQKNLTRPRSPEQGYGNTDTTYGRG